VENEQKEMLKLLSTLRVDRSKGIAPHKPLLLLVVLELARVDELCEPQLWLTPELAFRFSVYWSIVAHRRSQRPDVRLPFHHIGSSKLWTPLTADGAKSSHRELTASIAISPQFWKALKSAEFRCQAACILISNYFEHAEQVALYEMAGIEPPVSSKTFHDFESDADSQSRARGRSARFRVDVVAAYCHTCALTG
jgi:putative restriction endonuclease